MLESLIENGPEAYAAAYFFGLTTVAAAEAFVPRRTPRVRSGPRWARNVAITLLDVLLVRWIFPVVGIAAAIVASQQSWGLISGLGVPTSLAFVLALVLLDLGRWLQHFLLHRWPLLWRLHTVHHADMDYDFSTALRFHPLEALYTAVFNVSVVGLVGAPVEAVVVYELVAVVLASFSHGNLFLPEPADRLLRCAVVTPDLHRIHHSIDPSEQATNYASVCPVWDRLLGTYKDQPDLPHDAMGIGLREQCDATSQSFLGMLTAPFRA